MKENKEPSEPLNQYISNNVKTIRARFIGYDAASTFIATRTARVEDTTSEIPLWNTLLPL